MHLVKPNPAGLPSLDELFVEKYDWLLRWALHFTGGERAVAEDLVQDAFVRLAITHPELDHHDNAEALLYTYLKHVHLDYLHWMQRAPQQALSIAEFESIGVALRQTSSGHTVDVQNTLRRILMYLCWRKESAKAASILILRFFHGYFPEEIMQIGLLSRTAVDNGLLASRNDLRRYLSESESGKVQSLAQDVPPEFVPASTVMPTDQFIDELRTVLLNSRRNECLAPNLLAARYAEEPRKAIESDLLAHIVSCQPCLDLATHSKKIPPVAERSFESALVERHTPTPAGKLARKDTSLKRGLDMVHRRIREVLEHRPRSLSVVVNGRVIASQDVNFAVCRQEVEINIGAPIELVEVLSEQRMCLLAMVVNASPPEAPPEIYRQVRLSSGRTMEAWLRFTSAAPRVEITYRDPQLLASSEETAESHNLNSQDGEKEQIATPDKDRAPRRAKSLWSRFWSGIRHRLRRLALPDMNPTLATALVLAAASVVCLVLWWHQPPRMSANSLLVRAEAWDPAAHTYGSGGVVYEQIRITTSGGVVQREIHRDLKGVRRPKRELLTPEEAGLKANLERVGIDWDAPLSATSFQEWHDQQHVRQDSITRAGTDLLKLTTSVPEGEVRTESLTVRESDFHPVARSVELESGGTVEIAELDYQVFPWTPAQDRWFEPIATSPLMNGREPHAAILPRLPHLPSDSELDLAAIEARLALHQLNADSHERIEIERTVKGIQVKGIVATAERKREIEDRLHPIPYLFATIFTFDEFTARQSSQEQITSIASASLSQSSSPFEQILTSEGVNHAEISELGGELSDASITIMQESKSLSELLNEFGPDKHLSSSAQEGLDQLVADHKAKILAAVASEEKVLTKLEASSQSSGNGGQPVGTSRDSSGRAPASSTAALLAALDSHRALATELLSGNSPHPRSAREIALELDQSLRRLRSIIDNLSDPLPVSALSSPPTAKQNKK